MTVAGNGTYTTPTGYTLPTTGTVAGTYQWVVSYSGDANNNAVATPSGTEPVVVAPANLLLSTTINPSDVTLSNGLPPMISDSATLTGSYHATGTITFDLYGPDGVTIVYTATQSVSGDGTYTTTFSPAVPPPGYSIAGTYNWVVTYSGDGNNNGVASSFGSESVRSTRPAPASPRTPAPAA